MEKQRCARAAALSGKSLDCPGCNDPNQECSLHHVPGEKNFSFIQILIHPKLIEVVNPKYFKKQHSSSSFLLT